MLKAPFQRCKQYHIVWKKQTVYLSSSNSDTLVESALIVFPIHRLWRGMVAAYTLVGFQHPRWTVVTWLRRHARKLRSRRIQWLDGQWQGPSTLQSRSTPQSHVELKTVVVNLLQFFVENVAKRIKSMFTYVSFKIAKRLLSLSLMCYVKAAEYRTAYNASISSCSK